MFRALSLYSAYFLQFLKRQLEYRADFVVSIIVNIISTASGLLFIFLLMDGQVVQSLNGWDRNEVLFIYGFSLIPMAIFAILAPNLYRFGDKYIIEGQFDRVLLRPLSTLPQVLFETFNLESVGNLIVGIITIAYASHELQLSLGFLDILWGALAGISGGIILLSVFIFLASLSFHFEDRLGIAPPVYNLITFSRYPLPIFNKFLQFILSWVIPFAFIGFYPATHFLGHPEFLTLCYLTPLVAIATLSVAIAAWEFGASRYSSTGS